MENRVSDHLPQEEILAQLAEEAAELSQAALKLRRTLIRKNPTPVSSRDALKRLEEEIADVKVCLKSVQGTDNRRIQLIMQQKSERWIERLQEAERRERIP